MHLKFDEYLAKRGILLSDGKYNAVHKFIDKGIKFYGAEHRTNDPYHKFTRRLQALRTWLNGKYNIIGQDRATDWLRAGVGHLFLDYFTSNLDRRYSWLSIFDSAYRSMVQRGWTGVRFLRRK